MRLLVISDLRKRILAVLIISQLLTQYICQMFHVPRYHNTQAVENRYCHIDGVVPKTGGNRLIRTYRSARPSASPVTARFVACKRATASSSFERNGGCVRLSSSRTSSEI